MPTGQTKLLAVTILLAHWCAVNADELPGKVVGVSDGDTITVLIERTQVKVRLSGIDCPETGQDFGSRAKAATSELAFGKVVALH
jgi:endonuclease YncB( thermonuclease family)